MKAFFILSITCLVTFQALSQSSITPQVELNVEATSNIYPDIKKGDKFKLTTVLKEGYKVYTSTGKPTFIESYDLKSVEVSSENKVVDLWNKHMLKQSVFSNLLSKGFQYDLRNDLHTESVDFINSLNQQGRFFNDAYLEDYLFSLIAKIHGGVSNYNRPGNLSIRVMKDTEPNAFILPNGTIILSTGLLSTINSEDELMGILGHEVAHFILDHHIINYNKEIDRKKRAEFWSAFATVAAASADAYLSMKNQNHIPGVLTASTVVAATVLSDQITTRLGIKYNKEQETSADIAASEVISSLGFDKGGLAVALQRLKNYFVKTGNFLALSGDGTHPAIESRILEIGLPTELEKFNQPKYFKTVSLINSHNAWIELWSQNQPLAAYDLVQKNIGSGVATETDYVISAVIKRRNATTKEELDEVLRILQKAKSLNVTPHMQISKEEGLTQLRLNNPVEAKKALELYLKQLQDFKAKNNLDEVDNRLPVLEDEIAWTQKMIFKSDKF